MIGGAGEVSSSRPPASAIQGSFFLHGFVSVMLGPLIPRAMERWGLRHSEAASLFVALFVASSVGATLSSGRLRQSLVYGYGLAALGLAALACAGWPLWLAAIAVVGLGLGLSSAATNLLVAHMYPERRAAALSRLNLAWGLGAVSSPLLFALAAGRAPAETALWPLAAAVGVAALCLARMSAAGRIPEPAAQAPTVGARGAAHLGLMLLLASQLLLYTGTENSVGGWIVALAEQEQGKGRAISLLIGACFWGSLLCGRAIAPWLLRLLTEPALQRAALVVAGSGVALILLVRSSSGIAAGAVLAGAGLAPLFPLIISALAAHTSATRSRGAGAVLAFGGLGAAALPWLTGQLADASGLRRGFLVPAASLGLMVLFFAVQRIVLRRTAGALLAGQPSGLAVLRRVPAAD